MSNPHIRLATPEDAEQILAIYAPIVRDTSTSFEVDPPTVEEMQQRISHYLTHAPWLVCEQNGEVLGYVYASKHRDRLAYQWAVEVTAYVQGRSRRMGIGRALYTSLFKALALQGFYNAYAGITLPNASSVGLHEALGFTPIGVYRNAGYKLGQWSDVGWWQLNLQPHPEHPTAPRPAPQMYASTAWQEVIRAGEVLL
ncbi:MAG TPA: arsinothricin resistance N-acetyltransferase ArsN1 family B [Crinalium sp.]